MSYLAKKSTYTHVQALSQFNENDDNKVNVLILSSAKVTITARIAKLSRKKKHLHSRASAFRRYQKL